MDAETQQLAEKLARFVAEGGPEVEAIAAERNRENPAFRSVNICVTVFFMLCVFLTNLLLHIISSVPPSVFYMTIEVQPTASTKRNCRSIVLQPRRAPPLQQQSRGQIFSGRLLQLYMETLHI